MDNEEGEEDEGEREGEDGASGPSDGLVLMQHGWILTFKMFSSPWEQVVVFFSPSLVHSHPVF